MGTMLTFTTRTNRPNFVIIHLRVHYFVQDAFLNLTVVWRFLRPLADG